LVGYEGISPFLLSLIRYYNFLQDQFLFFNHRNQTLQAPFFQSLIEHTFKTMATTMTSNTTNLCSNSYAATWSQRRFGFVVNSDGFDVHSNRIDLLANETDIEDEECYRRCVCYPAAKGCDRKYGGCHVYITTRVYSRTSVSWPNPYVHWAPKYKSESSSQSFDDEALRNAITIIIPVGIGLSVLCVAYFLVKKSCQRRQRDRQNVRMTQPNNSSTPVSDNNDHQPDTQ